MIDIVTNKRHCITVQKFSENNLESREKPVLHRFLYDKAIYTQPNG